MTNKTRVLLLLGFLKEHTDEVREVNHKDIRAFFSGKGEKVSLPTIRDDIASLREAGYDINVREVNGVATYYKYLDREWTLPELQVLTDAVSSGQFITAKKTKEMIRKLKNMAGPSEKDQLVPGILVPDRVKAPNEKFLYIIQAVKEAIRNDEQISFRYYEYNAEKKRVPKHSGRSYTVSPYAMVWKKDRYYLVGWSEKHNGVAHFRIDRMGMPKLTGDSRVPAPKDLRLSDRIDRIFSMFDGPEESVTFRCSAGLMNNMIDQFGKDVYVVRSPRAKNSEESTLDVTAVVHLSPTFYGWLFQYTGEMTIVAPEHVRSEYADYLRRAINDLSAI